MKQKIECNLLLFYCLENNMTFIYEFSNRGQYISEIISYIKSYLFKLTVACRNDFS